MKIYFKNEIDIKKLEVEKYITENYTLVNKWIDYIIIYMGSLDELNKFLRDTVDIIHFKMDTSIEAMSPEAIEIKYYIRENT